MSGGGFFRKLFGGSKPQETSAPAATGTVSSAGHVEEPSEALLQSFAARERYWSSIGTVERDVIAYLVSPQFMGGPAWPTTRQAYRVIRAESSVILATDGMSDPFDDTEGFGNGFELELFIETAQIPETLVGHTGEVDGLKRSWAFVILERVAQLVADAGGVTAQLDRYGSLSVELPGLAQHPAIAEQVPPAFIAADETLGVLLGAPQPAFPTIIQGMPLSQVRTAPIVLLTASELDFVRAGHETARAAVVQRLDAGTGHRSDIRRPSVV